MSQKIKLKNTENFTLVNEDDFEYLNFFVWNETKGFGPYAVTGSGNNKKLMHRIIMNPSDTKEQVDHINGNGLDNRKENLRICNNQQNHFNQKKKYNF